ncbi:hypothetical protein VTH06DRAFT_8808 [Thermothelomyces fergusii]
MIQLV